MRIFNRLYPPLSKPWGEILNILDKEFYQEADEEQQFKKLEFIYYKLDDIYEPLVEKGLISRELKDQSEWKG